MEVLRKEEICPLSTFSRLHDGCFGLELQTLGVWSLKNTVSQARTETTQTYSTMGETSFQFQCPSCSAVLQATLQKELTSVQCGECYDVFDVQHPGR